MNKVELEKELKKLGIKVEAGKVRKSDVKKILAEDSLEDKILAEIEKCLKWDGSKARSIMHDGKKLFFEVDVGGNNFTIQLMDDNAEELLETSYEFSVEEL